MINTIEKTPVPIQDFFLLLREAIMEQIPALQDKVFLEVRPEDITPALCIYYHTIEEVFNEKGRENTATYVINFDYQDNLKTKSPYTILEAGFEIFIELRNQYSFDITASSYPGKVLRIVSVNERITPILVYDNKEKPIVMFQLAFKVDLKGTIL
jgi:hypothetical protein